MTGFHRTLDPVVTSESACLQHPTCRGKITLKMKCDLNIHHAWLRNGGEVDWDDKRYGEPRRSRIASFWMEGPVVAYQTWAQTIYKFLAVEQEYEATQSEETLRTVVNIDFGRPYLLRANLEQCKSELPERRAEDVPKRSVPDGVLLMIVVVDVQGGKPRCFVVRVTGYGAQGEHWAVDRYNIRQPLRINEHGEYYPIDPVSYPEDWDLLLSDVFEKSRALANGPSKCMRLMAMAVDSGREDGVTNNAHKF